MDINETLAAEGYTDIREIPGRGLCGLHNFMFTTGLCWGLDESGYRGRWCYQSPNQAKDALERWDGHGDPTGPWVKYKGEGGERRNETRFNLAEL